MWLLYTWLYNNYSLPFRKKQFLKEEEIREKLSGNICRCTGYTGIIKAVKEVMANRFKRSIND